MSHLFPATPRGRKARQRAIARNVAALPSADVLARNLRETYALAVEHKARPWYGDAHDHAVRLAARHGVTTRQACGVIAALSPSTSWERNLELADDLLTTGDCAHQYGDAIRKARRIAGGADPGDVLGGRKVRSFFANLADPARPGAVTIDRHAYSIAVLGPDAERNGRRTATLPDSEAKVLDRPGTYAYVAGVYRSVARSIGIDPHALQSITWDYWRDHHAYGVTTNIEAF